MAFLLRAEPELNNFRGILCQVCWLGGGEGAGGALCCKPRLVMAILRLNIKYCKWSSKSTVRTVQVNNDFMLSTVQIINDCMLSTVQMINDCLLSTVQMNNDCMLSTVQKINDRRHIYCTVVGIRWRHTASQLGHATIELTYTLVLLYSG